MTTSTEISVRQSGSELVRQEFGATEMQQVHETAAAAVAAREQAAVQARYIMAMQRPRNVEQFRKRLMDMCLKPEFAKKAEYAKPVGKKWNAAKGVEEEQFIYGPSIRFVEAALQAYGNVLPQTATVFDNPMARISRVSVTDLEANITYEAEVVIAKTVERKGFEKGKRGSGQWEPPKGRVVISERVNSYGDPTYVVVATNDEIMSKQNALLSKALRTNALRLLPPDVVEEAIRLARQTVANKDAQDPDAAKREILDYFATQGVEPVDIEAYLGKSISKPLLPAEIARLRSIYKAVSSGETTWEEIMAAKEDSGSEELAKETRERLIREAEEKKKAAQQQGQTDGNPASASGSGDQATSQTTEKSTPGTPNASHEAAGSAPTTPSETKPAASRPTFGRRNS